MVWLGLPHILLGNLLKKNLQLKDVSSRFKAIKIIGQMKAFYRQRISESNCARKETVDIDILATSANGDRKIMQSINPYHKFKDYVTWESEEVAEGSLIKCYRRFFLFIH